MFSKLFGRRSPAKAPSGYATYDRKTFEAGFGVTPEQSALIADDYSALRQFDATNEFSALVLNAGRDLHSLSQALTARYGLEKKQAAALSLFFTNVATARNEQLRRQSLGISQCIWLTSTCVAHAALSGQKFDSAVGIATDDGYLLPGVAIGCTCTSKPIIPGINS